VNPAWVAALTALAGVVGGLLIWAARRSWAGFRLIYSFLQDWNGEAGDNRGHEARPGVMERLVRLEHTMADIQGQVHLNGGGSLRDEVQQNTQAIDALSDQVAGVRRTVDELKAR
jgi:hypothetical protein